jgi:hypothetical protein
MAGDNASRLPMYVLDRMEGIMASHGFARRAGFAAAAVFAVVAIGHPAAWAQQFQRFFPLLIELPGWKGAKPDGVAMQMPGASVVTATREYERGEARVNVQIISGPMAEGVVAATNPAIKVETTDARMSTTSVDGMQVTRTYTISEKSGAVLVALGPKAVFSFTFNGINDDEGLALARRFDWKAIQAALPK